MAKLTEKLQLYFDPESADRLAEAAKVGHLPLPAWARSVLLTAADEILGTETVTEHKGETDASH